LRPLCTLSHRWSSKGRGGLSTDIPSSKR
jgi:hypothetical protein